MEFFLNYSFVRLELYISFFLLVYILFEGTGKFYRVFVSWKDVAEKRLSNLRAKEENSGVVPLTTLESAVKEKEEVSNTNLSSQISSEDRTFLTEATRIARSHIERAKYDEARLKIIEGLSIDKTHRDLNMLLAFIYEKEHDFKKAEIIYRDLLLKYTDDKEIYTKLGFVLSLRGKYDIAYEIYKKGLSFDENNAEILEMLANLAYQLSLFEEAIAYGERFLKFFPRNPEVLSIYALSLIQNNERFRALEVLKKLQQIEPYNQNIIELISKVELELELEKNFS